MEAKWYNKGYTPTLEEYLGNAWISSSVSLLSAHAIFLAAPHDVKEDMTDFLEKNQELVYSSSLILRLCNDLGTLEVINGYIYMYISDYVLGFLIRTRNN